MRSVKEKEDAAIKQMEFSANSHIEHVSFANSARNERIRGLQLNKHTNVKLKYECLENTGTLDVAEN